MKNSLDIIIVNWNAGQQLRQCLDSIVSIKQDGFKISRVVVVDNASTDGSVNGLDDLRLPLTIIRNKMNFGFAKGCNMGAWGSRAEYLLFLNPDTFLYETSLSTAIIFMESEDKKNVGIVGIRLVDEHCEFLPSCARYPTPARFFSKMFGLDRLFPSFFPRHFMSEWDHKKSRVVDQVMGAFFLVRRQLFEMLCGFDEQFFVYFEDVDFSLRAKQAGWTSYYLAESKAYHRGQGSSDQVKGTRLFYNLRSRILFGYKHFDGPSAIVLALGTILIEPLNRVVLGAIHLSGREMRETIEGYLLLWSEVPKFLRLR